jgi:hypothetical protein
LNSVLELLASEGDTNGPHLITVDELRAAGALDVPKAWRKSLGEGKNLFDQSSDDEEMSAADESDDGVNSDADDRSG